MGKLGTDQLVGKLVALWRETDPDKFDDAVAEARNHFTTEQEQSKRNDLENLFNSQIATLKDRGVPKHIIETLQSQKNAVVQKASGMTIGEGNIPFLPVIKPAYLGYYGLMAMVRNGSKEGCTFLNPAAITDQFETPDDIYYIYDVEDGNTTRGKNPQDAENISKRQSRSPLTAAEVINLCILTDVLFKHSVWATGSIYKSADMVPYVCLTIVGAWPLLNSGYVARSYDHWGSSASCLSR